MKTYLLEARQAGESDGQTGKEFRCWYHSIPKRKEYEIGYNIGLRAFNKTRKNKVKLF